MITEKITVKGLVQGIGYRPFVAETAETCGIGGWVRNAGGIVTILASGHEENVEQFLREIKLHHPIGARVEELSCEEVPYQAFEAFRIVESENFSETKGAGTPVIPADLATCESCLRELRDSKNRRYRHPFISCTSCGPRYSIIEKLPYDREHIAMKKFPMCVDCDLEYHQKGDVRRHAQTIACQECGPTLSFYRVSRETAAKESREINGEAALSSAIQELLEGGIVAVKDIGGYHLACTPFSQKTVQELRRLKGRERKPFAVMFPNLESIRDFCVVNEKEEQLLTSSPRPIVLLRKKAGGKKLAENVCGTSPDIGAMLPCNPLQALLLDALGPLIMTSGNGSGELLILDHEKMWQWMKQNETDSNISLALLSHDRPILTPLDDSVVRVVCGRTQIIRRGRGYVPNPIRVPLEKNIFAAGGDLKASFCYVENGKAYLSQYLGDLQEEGCFGAYQREKKRMKVLFGFVPEYLTCDLHPGYHSAQECIKSAREEKAEERLTFIQHHEAHVASVIAEHDLHGLVLGFAFDGTGFGKDKMVWGSEVFLWDGFKMERVAHLKPVRLIGGDEGARNADTILYGFITSFKKQTRERIQSLWEQQEGCTHLETGRYLVVESALLCGINVVESSSMGRLFDAVSAFLGVCHYNSYEGEAAIELENLAGTVEDGYELSIPIYQKGDLWLGNTEELFCGMLDALEKGVLIAEIARGFIDAVADFVVEITEKAAENEKMDEVKKRLRQIALSGGTFQNRILLQRVVDLLEEKSYIVYINEQVPPGDGGICLGQAYLCEKKI